MKRNMHIINERNEFYQDLIDNNIYDNLDIFIHMILNVDEKYNIRYVKTFPPLMIFYISILNDIAISPSLNYRKIQLSVP